MPDTKHVQRGQRLKKYAEEIGVLEQRLALAEQRGESEAYIRRLGRMITHRERRLKEGWPDA